MDPIFDLATNLSQGEDILPHLPKRRWGKIGINAGKKLWVILRDPWKGVRPWTSFSSKKFFQKFPKSGSMTGWHLKPRSFHSSTTQDIMVDTFKFTSKSKVWNNFCAGYSIRKLPLHLSPDLYSGRAKDHI